MDKQTKPFLKTAWKNLLRIVWIIAFISLYGRLFGTEQTLVGVAAVTGILLFQAVDLAVPLWQAEGTILGLFLLMGVTTQLARLHPIMGFFLHISTIYGIIMLTSRRFSYKTYMPFLLGYVFIQGNPVPPARFGLRMLALLTAGLLSGLSYALAHGRKKPETALSPAEEQLRFSYAVKMALGLSLAMLAGDLLRLQKGMWIAVTVLSLTQADLQSTHWRIRHRLMGTLAGGAIFYLLYELLLPESLAGIATLVLSYFYTFATSYGVQMIFVTISALSAARIFMDAKTALFTRIGLFALGVGITLLVHSLHPEKWLIWHKGQRRPAKKTSL